MSAYLAETGGHLLYNGYGPMVPKDSRGFPYPENPTYPLSTYPRTALPTSYVGTAVPPTRWNGPTIRETWSASYPSSLMDKYHAIMKVPDDSPTPSNLLELYDLNAISGIQVTLKIVEFTKAAKNRSGLIRVRLGGEIRDEFIWKCHYYPTSTISSDRIVYSAFYDTEYIRSCGVGGYGNSASIAVYESGRDPNNPSNTLLPAIAYFSVTGVLPESPIQ